MKKQNHSYFQKIQVKHDKQVLSFAKNHFKEIISKSENIDNFKYLLVLTHSGLTTKKTLRIVLYQAVQCGDVNTALYFADLLNRKLTYLEKIKIAKEARYPLEFCENHFPERLGELAAKGTSQAFQYSERLKNFSSFLNQEKKDIDRFTQNKSN